ncbi:MAG TPA: hypothetical protein VKZ84_08270 [Bacteriovoracaceae bacterium]|nr:hypothetical protein [Bacteriovoracaceae bacterium]
MSALKISHIDSDDLLNSLIQFKDVWHEGKFHSFNPDDLSALLILQRVTDKQVSYERAFRGWRNSPIAQERRSPGRAFYSWLNKHHLSIIWKYNDFTINPILSSPLAPRHEANDEFAQGHSFVIKPQMIDGRRIKLYVQDQDMIKILNLHIGEPTSLGELTQKYIGQRLKWEKTCMPAPTFLDWIIANGKRPQVVEGELGFFPQVSFSPS